MKLAQNPKGGSPSITVGFQSLPHERQKPACGVSAPRGDAIEVTLL